MSRIKLLLEVVEDMRSLADSLQAVADALTQDAPDPEPKTDPKPVQSTAEPAPKPKLSKTIKMEEIRAVLAEKSHDGLTAEVRALLQKYGADKLSAVDPQHYPTLLAEAEVLGNAP